MSKRIFDEFIEAVSHSEEVRVINLEIESYQATILYHKGLTDVRRFNEYYFPFFNENNILRLDKRFPGVIEKAVEDSIDVFSKDVFSGVMLIYVPSEDLLYKVNLNDVPQRSIESNFFDPKVGLDSHDAFIEDIDVNIALLQNRIKDINFKTESFTIGKRSKTSIKICYLQNIVNEDVVRNITNKLNEPDLDTVSSVNDITSLFADNISFNVVGQSASPDIIESSLANGRVIIFIDGFPVASVLPITLDYIISTKTESESPVYHAIYTKSLLVILLFLSIFLLGFYLSVVSFHSRNLSLILISEVKVTTRGANLPLLGEIIFILIVFEFLRLASSRTTIPGIQSFVIVVGGLLIGQNTVASGFVGAFTLVITAMAYLSAYAVSNHQHFINLIFYFRIFVLIGAFFAGLFGVIVTGIISTTYIYTKNSVGVPFLAPVIPFMKRDFFQMFLSKNTLKPSYRPESLKTRDQVRGYE